MLEKVSQGPSCELETVTFETQHQYNLLFGRLKVDQCKVCELQQSGTTPCLSTLCPPDVTHATKSPRPSFSTFVYFKQSKPGGRECVETRLHSWNWLFFSCDFCSEPNNESPLNVDAAELWENPAGASWFLTWVNLLLRLCEKDYSPHLAWEWGCFPSHGLGMKLIVCPHVAWEWGQLFVAVPIIYTSTVRKTLLVVLQSIRLYLCRSTKKQWKMKHDEHYHKPRENRVLVHSDCLERLCTLFCDFCDVCVVTVYCHHLR